jgi:hypothetical protein
MSSGQVLVRHNAVVMITYTPNFNGMRDAHMSLVENSITYIAVGSADSYSQSVSLNSRKIQTSDFGL